MLRHRFAAELIFKSNPQYGFPFTLIDGQSNQIQLTTGSFYIRDSVYEELYSTTRGAIYVNGINIQLHVEETTFARCYITQTSASQGSIYQIGYNYYTGGGAITYYCPSTDIVFAGLSILRVCVSNCSSRNHFLTYSSYSYYSEGQFLYAQAHNSQSININQTSVSLCSPNVGSGKSSISLVGGKVMINLLNSTKNYAQEISSNFISASFSLKFQFSSLINNIANSYGLIYINSVVLTHPHIGNLNIINNSQLSSSSYLIMNPGCQLSMKNCIFSLYNQSHLFGGANVNQISLINCYFDNYNLNFTITPIFLEPNTQTSTYIFYHFGSYLCPTPIPLPTQDPQEYTYGLPPTPAQSLPRSPTECFVESSLPVQSFGSILISSLNYIGLLLQLQ